MADDVDIDFEKMSLWRKEDAEKYFESGGTDEPAAAPPAPDMLPPLPKPSAEDMKKWFPKWNKQEGPKVRARSARRSPPSLGAAS